MWGVARQTREQEVRERQERQIQEARQTAMAARQAQFRQQLERQAAALRSLVADPRHALYVELLKEARSHFRFQLKRMMESTVEAPNEIKKTWLESRIELMTDLLEAPEQIAAALADQQAVEQNGQAAVSA